MKITVTIDVTRKKLDLISKADRGWIKACEEVEKHLESRLIKEFERLGYDMMSAEVQIYPTT